LTSLGRLIFFDQPGTGASDPVTPGALPTLEQWADSITAVLDELGSREAVLLASIGAFAPAVLFAATHPSRSAALVVLEGHADPVRTDGLDPEEVLAGLVAMWGTGEVQHVLNPDMPWNEEIRATWARAERLAASPATIALVLPLVPDLDVRAVLSTIRVPTLVIQHAWPSTATSDSRGRNQRPSRSASVSAALGAGTRSACAKAVRCSSRTSSWSNGISRRMITQGSSGHGAAGATRYREPWIRCSGWTRWSAQPVELAP
jgi:pimeloyl-ACP methyl ester carboxylesterase